MTGKFNQKFGKMVLKIKVLKTDETKATCFNAFKRTAVDIIISVLCIFEHCYFLTHSDLSLLHDKSYWKIMKLASTLTSSYWFSATLYIQYMSEYLTVMLNERKRSLLD